MAGGDLPPEVREKLMETANMLAETGQLDGLENNEYYTASVSGMTLNHIGLGGQIKWRVSSDLIA